MEYHNYPFQYSLIRNDHAFPKITLTLQAQKLQHSNYIMEYFPNVYTCPWHSIVVVNQW